MGRTSSVGITHSQRIPGRFSCRSVVMMRDQIHSSFLSADPPGSAILSHTSGLGLLGIDLA
jgi:hypothetical protein